MSSTSDTRSNLRTWSPSYATAPPASCATLRNYANTVQYGHICVFAEEDGDPVPFSINTACMPWVTPNVYPSASAFYSPATACPSSWSAVSTATAGQDWVSGETGLTCCPPGFEGDGRGGCKVGSSGTMNMVKCGEADAEENSNAVYTAGAWPASVTASITPLLLRYQASDVGSASATGSGSSSSSTGVSGTSGNRGNGDLSTGAKVAIGVVVPLVFIVGALAFFLLWRRRKQKKAAMALASKNTADEKTTPTSASIDRGSYQQAPQQHTSPASKEAFDAAVAPHRNGTNPHETPEWNVEMDATGAERQRLVRAQDMPLSASSPASDATELGGLARVPRKPIAPVEIDGNQIRAEVGDAYIPYRPRVKNSAR
ncbi:hypothetical protein EK21DRAFT_84462 [Setomelanomma holmii]|uniref:Uncharacterized protein n=1 Tax=Setomelanomma holmii TaxID=210430 RepID=A0A9P4HLY2_9PLEO|nr:hypothetical protein EK21DRAFT_84462 [Setomelanomma holmii]